MSNTNSFDAAGLADRWAEGWSSDDSSPWLSLYSPRMKYTDHAFQIVRIGTDSTLPTHWKIWRTAIPDFRMTITSVYPVLQLGNGRLKVIFKTDNAGTFENDLPRTKASGKPFLFKGVVEFVLDEASGLIDEVEEWYCSNFQLARSVEQDYNLKEDPASSHL
ncbi:hypothetical protein H2200_003566 [Cladophialophora chaetospira]|uniref:SnoaL-like domain-containing protein n=1 Tax=Cladophialophora chaetospira TaxID=386627 RepID=A0AA38XF49_9EURO|nr:hypothetical protein H2200_003566 [Cladophialophora chaetospira]